MDGGRSGGAGILNPRCALEAQVRRGFQHQGRGKILRREAGVKVSEQNLVDVGSRDGSGVVGPVAQVSFGFTATRLPPTMFGV